MSTSSSEYLNPEEPEKSNHQEMSTLLDDLTIDGVAVDVAGHEDLGQEPKEEQGAAEQHLDTEKCKNRLTMVEILERKNYFQCYFCLLCLLILI